jgi:hypothetical protein
MGYDWTVLQKVWTGLDRFFLVSVRLFGSCHNRQPVAVAVCQNWAEKPDWTGPLNTKYIQSIVFNRVAHRQQMKKRKSFFDYVVYDYGDYVMYDYEDYIVYDYGDYIVYDYGKILYHMFPWNLLWMFVWLWRLYHLFREYLLVWRMFAWSLISFDSLDKNFHQFLWNSVGHG